MRSLSVCALAFCIGWLFPASASAFGYAYGYLRHVNQQGNYCRTANCTGAKYPYSSQYNCLSGTGCATVAQPVKNVKIELRSNGNLISQSQTDENGYFIIYYPNYLYSANLEWHAEHSGNRFSIENSSGSPWVLWTNNFNLVQHPNPSIGSYTPLGNLVWGSTASPNAVTNVYDGAERAWQSFSTSARLYSQWSHTDVVTGSSACGTTPSNCARVTSFGPIIFLDTASATYFSPQARILHEMGHVAVHRASRGYRIGEEGQTPGFSYTQCFSGAGWVDNTLECRGTAFDEALATFLGSTALYYQNASDPRQCNFDGECLSENTMEVANAYDGFNRNRHQDNVKYLWDLYDLYDSASRPLWAFADTLYEFPEGNGNHEKNEHWSCNIFDCWADDSNERNADDWRYNWESLFGEDTQALLDLNQLVP